MCPSTSWSLSSFTRNIVFGRASVISPSISIFSSLPICAGKVASRLRTHGRGLARPARSCLAALERRLARPVLEKALDRALQVLAREQLGELPGRDPVGLPDAALAVSPNDALGRAVGDGRAVGQAAGKPEPLVQQLVVGYDTVDDVPAFQGGRVV